MVKTQTKTKITHFAKKQNNVQALVNLHNQVFARFYFLVEIMAAKFGINFTGDKGFCMLSLLSYRMLSIIEKIISIGADAPGVGLYWLTE